MFKRNISPLKNNNSTYKDSINHKKNIQMTYWEQHKVKKAYEINNYQIVNSQNYIFQGKFNSHGKNGEGVLFTRTGMLIVGNWVKNQLEGRAIIMTPFGGIIYCGFVDGKLDGWVLGVYGGKVMICTKYFQDKIDGQRIIFQELSGVWVASKYRKDGKFVQISHVEKGTMDKLPSFLRDDFLQNLIEKVLNNKSGELIITDIIKAKKITNQISYIGYLDGNNDKPQGLGMIYSLEEFYVGNFKDGALDCYGRIIFDNGDIYHGQFSQGMFEGRGTFYQCLSNSTTVVESLNNQFIEKISQEKGYVSISIQPMMGKKYKESGIGTNGNGLIQLGQFIEQYYFSYCVQKIRSDLSVASQRSQKPQSSKSQFSFPKRSKNKQEWIDMNGHSEEEEEAPQNLLRTNSLGKKQVQTRKNFQTTYVRQNYESKQQQVFNKKSPHNDTLKISMMPPSKSMDVGQITFRGDRIQSQQYHYTINFPEQKQLGNNTQSNHNSQISNLSLKVNNMLKKVSQRKRFKIFQ